MCIYVRTYIDVNVEKVNVDVSMAISARYVLRGHAAACACASVVELPWHS